MNRNMPEEAMKENIERQRRAGKTDQMKQWHVVKGEKRKSWKILKEERRGLRADI